MVMELDVVEVMATSDGGPLGTGKEVTIMSTNSLHDSILTILVRLYEYGT